MGLMGANGLSTRKIIDLIYPVGSIYMSANAVSPAKLFGGRWEQIQGRFMLTSGNGYSLGATGGEATHTLTVNEMPSHTHSGQTHRIGKINTTSNLTDNSNVSKLNTQGCESHTGSVNQGQWACYQWTDTVNNTGGGQPHNNLPPYIVVNAWKRTA